MPMSRFSLVNIFPIQEQGVFVFFDKSSFVHGTVLVVIELFEGLLSACCPYNARSPR